MATKLKLEIKGLEELNERIAKLGGDAKVIAEKALKESHAAITPNVHAAMKPHNKSGDTEKTIIDKPKVEWSGTMASVGVGFDVGESQTSIYLMYGTKPHKITHHNGDLRGTPRNHPGTRGDSKLKNSLVGSAVKNKIIKIQEDVFYDAIRKLGG